MAYQKRSKSSRNLKNKANPGEEKPSAINRRAFLSRSFSAAVTALVGGSVLLNTVGCEYVDYIDTYSDSYGDYSDYGDSYDDYSGYSDSYGDYSDYGDSYGDYSDYSDSYDYYSNSYYNGPYADYYADYYDYSYYD
ncbi:MAG: hypothetical protein GY868_08825 [Deltaproteobacteria bacterium]|nr:hypothetical protein [Deltaproteobacteria bacterium]